MDARKRNIVRNSIIIILGLLFLTYMLILPIIASFTDQKLNGVIDKGPYYASAPAKRLHNDLFIADLHADFLLWNRDLLSENSRGHVDLPRMQKGNMALQAFTIVSKVPRAQNLHENESDSDQITLLALGQHWPLSTLFSLKERALYQSEKLHDFAGQSEGQFIIIKTRNDLENFIKARNNGSKVSAGFLGIEGAHVLEADLDNLDDLYQAGFRMMAPTHFFDNAMGGSAHGQSAAGLTPFGKNVIRLMQEKNMLIDVAHASADMIDDVLALATTPVVSSHTGVKGTCDNQRNLSDRQIRGIARTGGVIGIGVWNTAVCGKNAVAMVRAMKYVRDLVGIDHVALGSDFDGAVNAMFDVSGLSLITEELMNQKFTEEEIRKIMGENVVRVLLETLPR